MLKSYISRIAAFTHSDGNRWLAGATLSILTGVASALIFVGASDASRPQASSNKAPAQASKSYTLYSGFWRTDGGFVSTIRIKNVLVVAPMDVVPLLFMADGTPYMLPSVHVGVSGVATININDALAAAPSAVAGHISQYGSAALIYSYSSPGHVTAQIAAIDGSRSLSFVFPFAEPMGEPMQQTVEGLWWKHDPGVAGFVALSNAMDADTQAAVQLVGPGNSAQAGRTIALPAHSTRMLHLEDLADNPSPLAKRVGGIRVQYTGQPGSVQVTGGLENDSEGYSANIPFWGRDMSSASPGQMTYASAGIMVGEPDPMMMPGFPKDTTFIPYLTLRNTSERPLDVILQLNYMSGMGMDGSAPVTRNLPAQHLGPFEARQVDMQAALNSSGLKGFNGSINLSTSFTGKAGDLVLATGSVDQTGSYVFEVEPESVSSFRSKNANYWGVANGNDTMFTLWNPTSITQDILVTFYYGDGSGKYNLPLHLGPQASTMIDMAMLIAEIKPGADGNIIPSNIQEGSAQFASAKGRNEQITLVIAAGIYNVSTATCGGGCINCCGGSNFGISPNPIFCPIGETMPCSSTAVDCNGYSFGPSSWSSDNPSVMTVNGSGVVTGVSVGQANIIATYLGATVYTGQMCGGNGCPTASPAPRAPGNVTTPSQHTYPNPPLTGCRVSVPYDGVVNATTGKRHQAQDTVGTNIQVGTPVNAPEAGTITNFVTGKPHDARSAQQCAGQNSPANFIEIRSDSDQALTRLYHVTILPSLATIGTHVAGGQQIGTIDISGCTSAPHTHIQRKVNGVLVNFTTPCDNSHFDDPSGYYDDSDGTWP